MASGTAVVVGVGAPSGLGAALARRFAREGLRVIVAGRTLEKLIATVEAIREAGGLAEAKVTDATCLNDVAALFDKADAGPALELVAYNVGNNIMLPFLNTDADVFAEVWRQNALGGFLVGQEAVRRLLPNQRGTLLFTGATASVRARPPFIAFASAKAALRAVAQGLAREFGPQGLHVAHVIIDGVIQGDYAQSKFPDFVKAKGSDGLIEVDAIAETYWALHRQPRSAWTHELDLRPFKEPF